MANVVFGVDVSKYQPNFNFNKAYSEGFRYAILRATTELGTTDTKFHRHLKQARKAGFEAVAAYHYVVESQSAKRQAKNFADFVGDKSVPVMLDHERSSGSEARNYAVAKAIRKRGYRVILNYMPQWYWQQIGKPKIRTGPMSLSKYVSGTGAASSLYGKVPASWWNDYGGQPVKNLQFSEKGKVAGIKVDVNAFKGSESDVAAFFNGKSGGGGGSVKPKPKKVVTKHGGTELDLSETKSGSKVKWRNLDRTDGEYPGCVCECVTQSIPLVEALLRQRGVLSVDKFTMTQGGYNTKVAASAGTHGGGGTLDIRSKGFSKKGRRQVVKALRQCGWAAWLRNKKHGGMTPHIHAVAIGCPHAAKGAKNQVADYKNGLNGLAGKGADYGPKVAYVSAEKARQKMTKTVGGGTAEKKGLAFDMLKQLKPLKRKKAQKVGTKWKALKLTNKGSLTWDKGGGAKQIHLRVAFEGVTADDNLHIRVYRKDTKSGTLKDAGDGNVVKYWVSSKPGGNGVVYRDFWWQYQVPNPGKGKTRRMRILVKSSGPTVKVRKAYLRRWKG